MNILITLFSLIALLIGLIYLPTNKSFALDDVEVFPPDSKPFGLSYGEWTAKWWQWVYGQPSTSTLKDPDGKNCMSNQTGPIWFLAGTSGGSVERNCTVPSGKAIMFPVFNSSCDYKTNPMLTTEEELRDCASSASIYKNVAVEATVDGVSIPDLEKYKVSSLLFNFTGNEDNGLGISAGTHDEAVGYGYYIILKPLAVGNHEVHFRGAVADFSIASPVNFVTEATYHLTVK